METDFHHGLVEAVEGQKITIGRSSDGHRHTQTVPKPLRIVVAQGEPPPAAAGG